MKRLLAAAALVAITTPALAGDHTFDPLGREPRPRGASPLDLAIATNNFARSHGEQEPFTRDHLKRLADAEDRLRPNLLSDPAFDPAIEKLRAEALLRRSPVELELELLRDEITALRREVELRRK
jgi:hypothetical protein